ncbi:serine/arginine repetitive matrix protein 1-like isoform X1 [Schistocerca piceifrons]|uniref:serine/arginine repetitive matrix protein 1-like isoform X1 n=1 Tax=Schistocerca piceifrons TaxID=274613 RepID=UPI001F5F7C92|nr:serine/arginine repetitive matrix protein 1-like isoform X1 [Schistocerca piceifrons]XP_047098773.1 serine/arginine repetitive matrix protein 1-like isoform X1 [Schistocerca piceifrons]XP_047098774.1 serine/arginine repetitive matrix protein 1-like isoform X1 [Schistocerca piceifrons]
MSWDSSRRRRSRSVHGSSSSRLRMDSYSSSSRSNRARASTPRKRELDKVMKKARRDGPNQSSYWNKKLLEVEEKDPNRWRHSGFKELYGGGSSPHGSTKRSRSRSRTRSPRRPRSRSRDRRAPSGGRARSPLPPVSRLRSRSRSRSRDRSRRPHTPPPSSSQRLRSSSARRTSPPRRARSPKPTSVSPSSRSVSSCSDESCSVCSPKSRKRPAAPRGPPTPRSRSRSFSVPRNRPARSPPPRRLGRERSGPPVDPRGPPPSPPPIVRKTLKERKKERERAKSGSSKKRKSSTKDRSKRRRSGTKTEDRGRSLSPLGPRRRPLPGGGASSPAPSCHSDESSAASSGSSGGAEAPRLTLSERFGKMAQWSVDRRDLDGVRNMRITKDAAGQDLKVVVIEGERYRTASGAPLSPSEEYFMPAPSSLADLAWDDVRVRYKYYKERGYLRDLSLDDYIKWEEWWYKYQEWLEAERYYEHWAALEASRSRKGWGGGSSSSRKRRRL